MDPFQKVALKDMHNMAGWQSGYAAACKAVNAGSIPASASTNNDKNNYF